MVLCIKKILINSEKISSSLETFEYTVLAI